MTDSATLPGSDGAPADDGHARVGDTTVEEAASTDQPNSSVGNEKASRRWVWFIPVVMMLGYSPSVSTPRRSTHGRCLVVA
jgi:hypothetical protein